MAVQEMFDDGRIIEKNMRYLIVDQPKAAGVISSKNI